MPRSGRGDTLKGREGGIKNDKVGPTRISEFGNSGRLRQVGRSTLSGSRLERRGSRKRCGAAKNPRRGVRRGLCV